eukprot:COSAG04_NODE_3802_length_2517_cov_1.544251_5_plen_38_part_01
MLPHMHLPPLTTHGCPTGGGCSGAWPEATPAAAASASP